MRRALPFAVAIFISLCGCAHSTAPGAIGVTRYQLLLVPSAAVEQKAAEAYASQLSSARLTSKLNTNASQTERVQAIAGKLIAQVGVYRPEAASWQWEVNVLDSSEVNAYCMPGGKIAVYTGLINELQPTDGELAAVMGHEIAHALREHSREKLSQGVLSQSVVNAIANSGARNADAKATLAQLGAQMFIHLPYSRDMELEADAMGMELMARAGYDPRSAESLWRKMQAKTGGGGWEFLRTHPSDEKRVAQVEAVLPKVTPLYLAASGSSGQSGNLAKSNEARSVTDGIPPQPQKTKQETTAPAMANALVAGRNPAEIRWPSQATPATKDAALAVGPDSYQIERMGRDKGCDSVAIAALTGKGPGFALYAYKCHASEIWSLRCEYGQCSVLQ